MKTDVPAVLAEACWVHERGFMARALILIAGVLLLREFLPRRSRWSPTAISPYMNSLDGAMSAEQVSLVMDELRRQEAVVTGAKEAMPQPLSPRRGCDSFPPTPGLTPRANGTAAASRLIQPQVNHFVPRQRSISVCDTVVP